MTKTTKRVLCAECGADITDPVRQFGDADAPLCWACYSGEALALDDYEQAAEHLVRAGAGSSQSSWLHSAWREGER